MPQPTPFHPRTAQLNEALAWKDWAGYFTARYYTTNVDAEYYALRHACGLIDVSPLFKYEISGPDACAFLSRMTVKDISRLKRGRVTYLCWCDDAGKLIDDGTVTNLGDGRYRLTAAEPSWTWLSRMRRGFDVALEDVTETIGALSLQGPTSRALLAEVLDFPIETLRFFRMKQGNLAGKPVTVSRTGYTGDLGYEIWVAADDALAVYDALLEAGPTHGLRPCGLDAMDITRIEAGFIMNGVDYFSAHHCLIPERMSSPYEAGLGWTVQLDRAPFIGQAALRAESTRQPAWVLRGVVLDWPGYEAVCAKYGLPPQISGAAWRSGVPIYDSDDRQIGYATSGTWSPILKQSIALATLQANRIPTGGQVRMEVTVEYTRHQVKAAVVDLPFYDPPQKKEVFS